MGRFIVKRLISSIISLFLFTVIIFFSVNLLLPGDYTDTLALQFNEAERDELREELGIDKPLTSQYVAWLSKIVRGDFGNQYFGRGEGIPVASLLAQNLPPTLLVFFSGTLVAFFIGQFLGKWLAWRPKRALAGPTIFASILAYTAFPPWLGFLLTYLLIDRWGLLGPESKSANFTRDVWGEAPLPPSQIMMRMTLALFLGLVIALVLRWALWRFGQIKLAGWVYTIFALLFAVGFIALPGHMTYAIDVMKRGALPFIAFTVLAFGDTLLIMRQSMLDTKYETYIQLARAKGANEKQIRNTHAARNAILPVLTRLVINLPYLLTAIVIVENATNWIGVGDMLFRAMYDQNTFVYMGIMTIVAVVTLTARFALELAYALLDPRISVGSEGAI